jgi:hypothetical protein
MRFGRRTLDPGAKVFAFAQRGTVACWYQPSPFRVFLLGVAVASFLSDFFSIAIVVPPASILRA